MTLSALIKEIKKLPSDKLDELTQLVHSLGTPARKSDKVLKKILSYGGIFNDMSSIDYEDFKNHITQVRSQNFDRTIDL